MGNFNTKTDDLYDLFGLLSTKYLGKIYKTSILVTEKTEKGKGFTFVLVSGNGQKEIPKSNDIILENRYIANEDETST